MFKRVLVLALASSALSACSIKIGGSDSGSTSKPSDPPPKANLEAKLQKDDISGKTYTLKQELNFGGADGSPYDELGSKMVEYAYAYNNGQRLTVDQAKTTKSYCGFVVDLNETTKPSDADFPAGGRLLKGEFITSTTQDDLTFSLQLQGHVFQSFFLSCKNVFTVDEIKQHVGDLIEIK